LHAAERGEVLAFELRFGLIGFGSDARASVSIQSLADFGPDSHGLDPRK
jgi:hypothetical protein